MSRCVCCGEYVPEGRQVCPIREKGTRDMACEHKGITIKPDGIHELSPHAFQEELHLRNVTVQVLRCKTCGYVSIGWRRQNNTEEVTEDG